MHQAVITTTVTTPVTVPWRLFVDNEDVLKRTDGSGVGIRSVEIEYAGSGDPATMRFVHDDPAKALTLQGRAEVRLWNQSSGADEFGGYLLGRTSRPAFGQQGRATELAAIDWSDALDANVVTRIAYPAGLDDREIIQSLLGNFCIGGGLSWAASTVALTNGSMPAMTFELQTLRAALDQVATAAAGDGAGDRTLFVRPDRAVRYYLSAGGAAPYVVTDNPSGGAQIAPEELTLVDDDSMIRTAVYVVGANAAGSGWETNGAAIALFGYRADVLNVPDSDSALKRAQYGQAFLAARAAPVRRGSFFVLGTTGWLPDQVVTITNAALGLSGATFQIKHVTAKPMAGGNVWRHDIEFGARKARARRGWILPVKR